MIHELTFVIYPCEDLFIKLDVEVDITFPPKFQTAAGEIVVRPKQPEVFRDSRFLSEKNEIVFPWLEHSIKYPISVWFYTVRQLLKRVRLCPWSTPVLTKCNFLDNREQLISEGIIKLEATPMNAEGALSNHFIYDIIVRN
jgi:hypothetical protein